MRLWRQRLRPEAQGASIGHEVTGGIVQCAWSLGIGSEQETVDR